MFWNVPERLEYHRKLQNVTETSLQKQNTFKKKNLPK